MSRRSLWMAAALVALVACEKAQEVPFAPEPVQTAEDNEPWVLHDLTDQLQPGPGGPVTLGVDFIGTRAHIDMNDEGTFAGWIWKSGDSFRMYGFNETKSNKQVATFSTTEEGACVDFTTRSSITLAPPYYVVFPSPPRFTMYNNQPLFGVTIPAEQEAVAGGIKDGYTIAYATAQNMTDNIHFDPVVSLVRFRMSGSVTSQVKSVTIRGTRALAGDIVLLGADDRSAALTDEVWFTTDNKSLTVTLSGDFVAGKDYYIVLKPGVQSRFEMVFADETDHYTVKSATNFTFPQGRICDFGTIDLGNAFEEEIVNYEPIQYMAATAGAPKPVTIAVIGDGFTQEEMSSFVVLAKSGIDALMNTEPYKTYKDYFNVWILRAASRESGANVTDGQGNITKAVNCYFGSKWGDESYGDMQADAETLFDFVTEHCPDIQNGIHGITEVPVLMVINDSRYGGKCISYSNGQGYGMVPFTYEGASIYWSYPSVTPSTVDPIASSEMNANYHWTTQEEYASMGRNSGDWRNTLVHEFGGHCFGRLGDEYWNDGSLNWISGPIQDQRWPVPFALNLASDPTSVTWQEDVLNYPLEDLVARDPNYGRIGIFQGGAYYIYGRWRSEMISCMIDNRYYFSTWQRMLIVKRIMSLSGSAFNAASFWEKDVTLDPVRDIQGSPIMGGFDLPVREMPLLPPPELIEVKE